MASTESRTMRATETRGRASPGENLSMQQRAYLLLKEMIEQGRIRPGEKLLEVQVARSFGISRSPARHALQALCKAGMLRDSVGRGYQVAGKAQDGVKGQAASLEGFTIAPSHQWERMYKEVEQELCIRILFGTVRITEERLADHFGVSRTVARDVLARMHSVGLVGKDKLGHWHATRVTPTHIKHLFELRCLLEPEALRQSAPFVTRQQLESALDGIEQTLAAYPARNAAIDRAETDLHIDLLSHCPNREILHALSRTHLLFVPTRYLSDPYLSVPDDILRSAFQEHQQIIELLLARKVAKAAARLHDHIRDADVRWLRRFEITAQMPQTPLPPYLSPVG